MASDHARSALLKLTLAAMTGLLALLVCAIHPDAALAAGADDPTFGAIGVIPEVVIAPTSSWSLDTAGGLDTYSYDRCVRRVDSSPKSGCSFSAVSSSQTTLDRGSEHLAGPRLRSDVGGGDAYDSATTRVEDAGALVSAGSRFFATRASGGVQSLDPSDIRLSQSSVNRAKVLEYTDDMAANGWRGDPVDVVRMPDGRLTTFDNKRVVSANNAGINVQARVHGFDDAFPTGRLPSGKGDPPGTWGQAINDRIAGQKPAWRSCYPMGGPFTCLTDPNR